MSYIEVTLLAIVYLLALAVGAWMTMKVFDRLYVWGQRRRDKKEAAAIAADPLLLLRREQEQADKAALYMKQRNEESERNFQLALENPHDEAALRLLKEVRPRVKRDLDYAESNIKYYDFALSTESITEAVRARHEKERSEAAATYDEARDKLEKIDRALGQSVCQQ